MAEVAALSTICTVHQRIHISKEKWSITLERDMFYQILGDDELIEGNCPDCLTAMAEAHMATEVY
jgi:hypothetical protein